MFTYQRVSHQEAAESVALLQAPFNQLIGLREKILENPIFHGKIYGILFGFRVLQKKADWLTISFSFFMIRWERRHPRILYTYVTCLRPERGVWSQLVLGSHRFSTGREARNSRSWGGWVRRKAVSFQHPG